MDIACLRSEPTEALFDGTVPVDGTMQTAASLSEIFEGVIRDQAFDAAELGLTFYLRTVADGLPYVALPIFPTRVFRHSCVFVNKASGITGPADLVGKTIGEFGTYGQDSGVWAKGALMDDYGFKPEQNRWVIGGLDRPMPPFDFIAHPHPDDVEVSTTDKALSTLLDAGEIDALFTANVPRCVLDGSPNVTRLFPDYEAVEREYHARTGIFPMMHVIVVRRELLERAEELYRAFTAAKDLAADRYRQHRKLYQVQTMAPWMNSLVERNEAQFAGDWWAYGIAANRTALDAFLRHHFEQGLSSRRWPVEDLFALLDT